MLSHLEPAETFDEPGSVGLVPGHAMVLGAFVTEWRYDTEGTRYRAIVVHTPATGRVLVAIDPDERLGRSWWAFDWKPGDLLSAAYVRQKWRINSGDDARAITTLLAAALARVAILEGADASDPAT